MSKKNCIIAGLLSIISGVLIALLLDGIAVKITMGMVMILGGFAFWMVIVYILFNKADNEHKYYVPLCICSLIATYSIVFALLGKEKYKDIPTVMHIIMTIVCVTLLGVGYFAYKAMINEQKWDKGDEDEEPRISPKPRFVYDNRTGLCVRPEKLCCDVIWTDKGPKYVEHIDED